jgi:hypothetical protein
MLVAASVMLLALSTQGAAQSNAHGAQGNAHGLKKSADGLVIPIATVPGSAVTGSGTFLLQKFVNDGGMVKAVGIVSGTFAVENGTFPDGVTKSVSIARNVTLPVSVTQVAPSPLAAAELNDLFDSGPSDGRDAVVAQLTCPILHLDLGPLSLDLLGLEVDLSRVILDIVANPAGGLLGNLLCAVSNLLGNVSALNALVALLNEILGALLG